MSPAKQIRNFPASVHQRLLNLAHERGLNFNPVLERYAVERFLYRLSISGEVDRFTLKGAALYRVWADQELRPTRDVDFLGVGPEDHAAIRNALKEICDAVCLEDGVVFDPATIEVEDIRGTLRHAGLRARILGRLGRAELPLQVDIGFGDVITPKPKKQDYPALLNLPVARIWTCPRETVVAEKFEAMVHLGVTNSRVKDLWDISCLARLFAFDGETLQTAINNTFKRRRTELAEESPLALLPHYYEATNRAQQWQRLQRQIGSHIDGPVELAVAGEEIRRFLGPIYDSLNSKRPFTQVWPPGGPWQPGV